MYVGRYFPPPHLLNLHLRPNAHRWSPINHISSVLSEHTFGLLHNCTHSPAQDRAAGFSSFAAPARACIHPLTSRDMRKAVGLC